MGTVGLPRPDVHADTALIPAGACVVSDEVSLTIAANRFTVGSAGCPDTLDSLATTLVATNGISAPARAQANGLALADHPEFGQVERRAGAGALSPRRPIPTGYPTVTTGNTTESNDWHTPSLRSVPFAYVSLALPDDRTFLASARIVAPCANFATLSKCQGATVEYAP